MSDHLPLWVEIPTDLSGAFLKVLSTPPEARPPRRREATESERAQGTGDAAPPVPVA
jgi:hypothetical protein